MRTIIELFGTGFNEIVFKDRNKDYGAYLLRKTYKKNVIIATAISVALCCAFVLVPFFVFKANIYLDGNPSGFKYVSLTAEHLNFPAESSTIRYTEMMTTEPIFVDDMASMNFELQEDIDEIFQYEESNDGSVHGALESSPSFQGGDIKKFSLWVVSHIEYPEEAKKTKFKELSRQFLSLRKMVQ